MAFILFSSAVLRSIPSNTGNVTNFIFRNISKSYKLTACAPINTKEKVPNKVPKKPHLPENITLDSTGYVEGLKSNIPTNNNINNKSTVRVTETHDLLKQPHDVECIEGNIYKLKDALEDLDEKLPGPLDSCDEDLSHIGPYVTPTFHIAKFADKSRTIQQLVKLGVEFYKLEHDRDVTEMFLSLDFDKDVKPYIQFLHDCGVSPENLGNFITRNPFIFKEDMDDLHTRIRYLRAHNFTTGMIQLIVNRYPLWLSFTTKEIDKRLSYFQNTFTLSGSQVRELSTKCPKLITYNMQNILKSTFSVKEEMGFTSKQIQDVLLKAPRVWIRARVEVIKSFDYAHNQMKLSHVTIALQPKVLLCRVSRLQKRHEFLVLLQRNQYDPKKPLYVAPVDLISGSDIDFCENIAKTSVDTYNLFLKSL